MREAKKKENLGEERGEICRGVIIIIAVKVPGSETAEWIDQPVPFPCEFVFITLSF